MGPEKTIFGLILAEDDDDDDDDDDKFLRLPKDSRKGTAHIIAHTSKVKNTFNASDSLLKTVNNI